MMDEGILSSVHQLQHRVGYYNISYSVMFLCDWHMSANKIVVCAVCADMGSDRPSQASSKKENDERKSGINFGHLI